MQLEHPLLKWIGHRASLLDLGCGKGEMLQQLHQHLQIRGFGADIDTDCLRFCLSQGLSVVHQNLNEPMTVFADNSFDLVLAKDVLHYTHHPEKVLAEMLRIGNRAIIGFNNYGWWKRRIKFMVSGSHQASHQQTDSVWYQEQMFKPFSINDFVELCRNNNHQIIDFSFIETASPLGYVA
ncbi:MAG: methionine biosynthesis protein MetW, partial [Gammaproteobacteria bacterium]